MPVFSDFSWHVSIFGDNDASFSEYKEGTSREGLMTCLRKEKQAGIREPVLHLHFSSFVSLKYPICQVTLFGGRVF